MQDVSCGHASSSEFACEESEVATEFAHYIPYSTLSSALTDCNYEDPSVEAVEQSTAPPLMTSIALNEQNYEYALPRCYSPDDLKNFYSNQSANMIETFENEFLEVSFAV